MAVVKAELKYYKSKTISDTDANGGLMSATAYTSGAVENVFSNILSDERAAGSTKYRKIHCKVANASNETFYSSKLFLFAPTTGEDWVVIFAGTHTDTQADVTGSERIYGAATLATGVSASDTTFVVNVEDSSIAGILQAGDKIILCDKSTPTASTGNEEELTIATIDSVSGTQVTFTSTTGCLSDYAAGSKVSSVLEYGNVECGYSNWAETGSFTYDEDNYPPAGNNIGAIAQTITITFLSATTFSVVGSVSGTMASGNTSTDYAPTNDDFSVEQFTLYAAGWGGTPVAGDTLVFKVIPAVAPIWEKRVIPVGCDTMASNSVYLRWRGETIA